MPKVKVVPLAVEREYIKLDDQLKSLASKHKKAKAELLRYYEKGYEFTLIRPSDTSEGVFSPPWKKIALELMHKFMTSAVRKAFLKSLIKRFPKREKAPALKILGKKAKEPING